MPTELFTCTSRERCSLTGWHARMRNILPPALQAVACCAMHAGQPEQQHRNLGCPTLKRRPARRHAACNEHSAHFMAGWISKLRTRAGPAVRSDSCSRCRCTRRRTADCCLHQAASSHQSAKSCSRDCLIASDACCMCREPKQYDLCCNPLTCQSSQRACQRGQQQDGLLPAHGRMAQGQMHNLLTA